MKRTNRHARTLAALVAASAFAPTFASAQVPTPSASATFAPGTYRQVDPATSRVMKVGNTIVVTRAPSGSLRYALAAVRPSDLNTGEVAGVLSGTHRATSTDAALKCKLYFTANDGGFVVSQDLPYGDCGFGYGVVASGIYTRASR